jgi:integrase
LTKSPTVDLPPQPALSKPRNLDKRKAEDIEAKERSRLLGGRHGIEHRQEIMFAKFAEIYITDHSELYKRSVARDREVVKTLNRFFGPLVLSDITRHRIQQFMRDRVNGRWGAFRQKKSAKPVRPAILNRELDLVKSIFSKAVEWNYLADSPARGIKRFNVQNTRTRILSEDEQRRLLAPCDRLPKFQVLLTLLLITGARVSELLNLRWEDCEDGYVTLADEERQGEADPHTHARALHASDARTARGRTRHV